MSVTVLMGTQWGDEGKGKITDILSNVSDAVVRYQGGNNAGHTIVVKNKTYKLHIVPSGVLREGKLAVIGDGCVVDPWVLKGELDKLMDLDVRIDNVILSDRAHLIMPYHREIDSLQEGSKKEGKKVGTTGRGIGPCYQDKAARTGIRAGDLKFPELLREKFVNGINLAEMHAKALGSELNLEVEGSLNELIEISNVIRPLVQDTSIVLNKMIKEGKNILLEGAQGAFLDLDKGTYPFVTSSSCTAGYASAGSGIGPLEIEKVVGVVKAYTTRVGEGPFPTELKNKMGERIQEKGHEFGTTTERPRRCGWLDLVMVRSSVMWNSITDIALTKIDILSGIDPLMVCTHYQLPQEIAEEHGLPTVLRYFPSHIEILKEAVPVYMKVNGWKDLDPEDWKGIEQSGDIPRAIRSYISLIDKEVNSSVTMLSYGKGREQTIDLGGDLI
ncbi:MAG: adenylosuccinate synthase [Candidatus Thermoplasmatota archaeon]|nr:adenylosuccinate synthase [Candidatus Thermoplasmatota archaeon]